MSAERYTYVAPPSQGFRNGRPRESQYTRGAPALRQRYPFVSKPGDPQFDVHTVIRNDGDANRSSEPTPPGEVTFITQPQPPSLAPKLPANTVLQPSKQPMLPPADVTLGATPSPLA